MNVKYNGKIQQKLDIVTFLSVNHIDSVCSKIYSSTSFVDEDELPRKNCLFAYHGYTALYVRYVLIIWG